MTAGSGGGHSAVAACRACIHLLQHTRTDPHVLVSCAWEGNRGPGVSPCIAVCSPGGSAAQDREMSMELLSWHWSGSAYGKVTVGTDPRVHVQLL